MSKRYRTFVLTLMALLIPLVLYFGNVFPSSVMNDINYGYFSAIWSSTIWAVSFSLIINLLSLLLAVFLIKKGFRKKQLAFLILTFFLGSITASFTWRNVLFDEISFFTENTFYLSIGILMIQFWKIGLLLTYFYFFIIQDEVDKLGSYIKTHQITHGELLRDFILPKVKKPYLINTVLIFVFTFFDSGISEHVFATSRGQGNELINAWLGNIYDMFKSHGQSTDLAFNKLVIYSILSMTIALLAIGLTTLLGKYIFNIYCKRIVVWVHGTVTIKKKPTYGVKGLVLIAFLLIIIYPLLHPIADHGIDIRVIPYFEVFKMILLTIICSLTIVFISLYAHFAVLVRSKLSYRNNLRLTLISFVFFLVPPVLIQKASTKLKNTFRFLDDSVFDEGILWFLLQALWSMPMVLLFSLPIVYSINKNRIKYDRIHKVQLWNSFRNNVLAPFHNSVLLLFCLITAIVWNDVIINSIFSHHLYSFASAFERVVNSRIVNYQTANFMLLLSIIISLVGILLYRHAEREIHIKKNL